MLPVIIWSPLEQYAGLISSECPKCTVDGVSCVITPTGWTDGCSSENQPRLLHCVNSNAILVSRIYQSPNQHRVLAHHPAIIHHFTTSKLQCLVPFHLWHITGFTDTFMEYVDHVCQSGIPMQQIERMLVSNRARLFYTLKEKFEQLRLFHTPSEMFPSFDDDSVSFWKMSPTRHSIEACFLHKFWERETVYHHHMSMTSLPTGRSWLSCDHTFKSVCNIGTFRQLDTHWIKQYVGLFCVLNAEGQVLSWKMTKSLTFDHIKDNLLALQKRLNNQDKQVTEFFVDTCCSLRPKLQAIFGSHLKVYLDIFHAVQRISKAMPKRHPYHRECLKSLQLVFRDPSDQGEVRTKPTPSPHILRQQLLHFQGVWKGISYNGRDVLPPTAQKEIKCVLVHIDKGCLSGILPSRGTNRNERLHRDINSHMTKSRCGVELAYALLTSFFFTHNEYISASRECRTAAPISAYCKPNGEDSVERFGLSSVHRTSESPQPEVQALPSKVNMAKVEYKEVTQLLNTLEVETLDQHSPPDCSDLEFTPEDALSVLKQAVSSFYVSQTLQQMGKSADFDGRNIFFTSFLAMIEGLCNGKQSEVGSGHSMESLLMSWNLKRVPAPGDGNCLFTSVAFSLVQNMQGGQTCIIERLLSLGIPQDHIQDVNYIQQLLRVRMAEEWNANQEQYQGFITEDISTLTHEYLQSGHYSGCAGDLMVLTLANILQMPITIFTSVSNMPLVCVMPTSLTMLTTQPIFLVYTQSGPGHYDSAISVDSDSKALPKKRPTKYTCGRSPKFTGVACSSLRCACIRDKECTRLCVCKQCSIQYGTRPPPSSSRRRQSYDSQRQPLQGKSGNDFLLEVGEPSTDGHLTTLEVVLLKTIIIYFILHGFQVSAKNVFSAYKQVFKVTQHIDLLTFPLLYRNLQCVERFLSKVFHHLQLLYSL